MSALDMMQHSMLAAIQPILSLQERQSNALCLKHAINNLLQADYFSRSDLDGIARALPHQGYRFLNPHKWLCFGNYDVVWSEFCSAVQTLGNVGFETLC